MKKVKKGEGAYALVTGASSGIGLQYARQLAQRGYNLLMVSNEDSVHERVRDIAAGFAKVSVRGLVLDLAETGAAESLHSYCAENGLQVEVLVNNAGIYNNCDFLDDSWRFNSAIMLLHVYTPTMLMYLFGKDMAARGYGYILNMSSVTSAFSVQRIGIYCSTKAYLQRISRSAHVELSGRGVVVTCVRPGAVATDLYNLSSAARRLGLALGYITTPERLAQRGLDAMFRGRSCLTPGLYTKLLDLLIRFVPTWALKLIRRWGIY